MSQIPEYKGDAHFKVLLERVGAAMNFPLARATIMRNIWAVDMVKPSETIAEVRGKDAQPLNDAALEHEFTMQFLALWTKLIQHLEIPFKLAPLENAGPDMLRVRHLTRVAEIKCLMGLFDFDRVRHPDLAAGLDPAHKLLSQVLSKLDVDVPPSDTATPEERADFEAALTSMEEAMETLFNQLGRRIKTEMHHKKFKAEEHKQFLEKHKDLGPNEPCPCGSGAKFKKCCFLKLPS